MKSIVVISILVLAFGQRPFWDDENKPWYDMNFFMEDGLCKLTINMEDWGDCHRNTSAWFTVWVYENEWAPEWGGREISCEVLCPKADDSFEGICYVTSAVKSFDVKSD